MSIFYLKNQVLLNVCIVCILFSINIHGQNSKCDSLYPISYESNFEYKWGYIDCVGQVIVNPDFEKAFDFIEGIGILVNQQDSVLVDIKGNKKVLSGIRILTRYSEGVAIAAKQGGYFVIDKNGAVMAKLPEESEEIDGYFFVNHFSNGLAPVNTVNGIGFINKTGKFVISPQFNYTNGFVCAMAPVTLDGKWALIDRVGKFIIPPIDDSYISISDPSDGLVVVQGEKDEWKYFNKNGDVVLKVKYDYAGKFVAGLAQVKAGKSWGFIDKNGKEVIPLKFGEVGDYSEGLAAAEINLNWGFIDQNGKFIIPPTFEYVQSSFKNGLAYVRKSGIEGYINKKGKWVWKRKT